MRSVAVMKRLETSFVRYALATHRTFISKCTLNMCLDIHTCVFMLVCAFSLCEQYSVLSAQFRNMLKFYSSLLE